MLVPHIMIATAVLVLISYHRLRWTGQVGIVISKWFVFWYQEELNLTTKMWWDSFWCHYIIVFEQVAWKRQWVRIFCQHNFEHNGHFKASSIMPACAHVWASMFQSKIKDVRTGLWMTFCLGVGIFLFLSFSWCDIPTSPFISHKWFFHLYIMGNTATVTATGMSFYHTGWELSTDCSSQARSH